MPSEGKPTVPQSVLDLVDRFERNRDAYKTGNYNETQLRREFLDPFFKALGWDIDNEQGYGEGVPRILVPSIGKLACFALDESGALHFLGRGGGGGGYALVPRANASSICLVF